MAFLFSKIMSAGTAAYAVFALAKPRHLGNAVTADPSVQAQYDPLARIYGFRDLAVSAVALASGSREAARSAMLMRIFFDLTDAVVLAPRADAAKRQKLLGAALGWGALNTVAVLLDARSGAR